MPVLINTVIPLFSIVLVGYLAGRFKVLGQNSAKVLNEFVMKFPLPILVFSAIADESIQNVFNPGFLAAFSLGLFIPQVIALIYGRLRYREPVVQTALRALTLSVPNTAFLGIPLLGTLFGKEGILIAAVATFLTIIQMLFTIVICEIGKQSEKSLKEGIKHGALLSLKHPMMISTFLGVLYSASGLPMPKPLGTFTHLLGEVAGPCALFALGQLLVGRSLAKGKAETTTTTIIKLAVQPVLTLGFLLLFDVEPIWAAGGMLLSSLPTAVAVSVFTGHYGCYMQRGIAAILVSTIVSIGSMILFIGLVPIIWPYLRQ